VFVARRVAPWTISPTRWRAYCRFICLYADHFNDSPYYVAPEAPWAYGGKPLDGGALRDARNYAARMRREARVWQAQLRADAEREAIEEQRIRKRARARAKVKAALAQERARSAREEAERTHEEALALAQQARALAE
jgi:hypothetical protein